MGATVHDCGLLTTPQLHYSVKHYNDQAAAALQLQMQAGTGASAIAGNSGGNDWSPAAALRHYYESLSAGFLSLSSAVPNSAYSLIVDGTSA